MPRPTAHKTTRSYKVAEWGAPLRDLAEGLRSAADYVDSLGVGGADDIELVEFSIDDWHWYMAIYATERP